MSARGTVQHNSAICSLPVNEHTGNEVCLVWVEEKPEEPISTAYYTQGPQGNQVADYRADFAARYGRTDKKRPLGTPEIVDRRDNTDPETVGKDILAVRAAERATVNGSGEVAA